MSTRDAFDIAASAYLRRIRNIRKRLYGHAYLGYLSGRRPEPDCGNMKMAAQSVRLELHAIYGKVFGHSYFP